MMKKVSYSKWAIAKFIFVLPLITGLLVINSVNAQTGTNTSKKETQTPTTVPVEQTTDNELYLTAETLPQFPGGQKEMMEYLQKNIKYPADTTIQGKVYISFIVDKDGSITNASIKKGFHPDFDNEALRIIKNMPKWIPGKNEKGEAVKVQMVLPFAFSR